MNRKLTFPELAELLSAATNTSKRMSELMLRETFAVAAQCLMEGESVKIKDLGVFKVLEVNARRSVDVNTGKKIEIPGHKKIAFVPDKRLAEAVNASFAAFEAVILDDDVSAEMLTEIDNEPKSENTVEKLDQTNNEVENLMEDENMHKNDEKPVEGQNVLNEQVSQEQPEIVEPEPEPVVEPEPEPVVEPEPEPVVEPEPVAEEMVTQVNVEEDKQSDNLPSDEPTEEPAEEPTEEPAEEPVEELTEEPVEEPTEESTNEPANETSDESGDEPDDEEVDVERDDDDSEGYYYDDYDDAGWWRQHRFFKGFLCGMLSGVAVTLLAVGIWHYLRNNCENAEAEMFTSSNEAVIAADTVVANVTDSVARPDTVGVAQDVAENNAVQAKTANTAGKLKVVTDTVTAKNYLARMARRHYGNNHFWVYIYEENRDKINNPNSVKLGTVLVIPPAEKYGIDKDDKQSIERACKKEGEIQRKYLK
ncbi:MAG: HU family DNA-binding protein [Muribaculaceae bacterium]